MTSSGTVTHYLVHIKCFSARIVSTYVSVTEKKEHVSISGMEEKNNTYAEWG